MGAPSEEDVGIIEYVSPVPGFRGILKHRFRDFLVREVDLKGQVARLTTLEPDDKADDESTVPAAREVGFSPEQLAATRAHVVASFSLVAGGENGALLDDLLRRVVEMYGMKDLQGEGKGPGAAMAESGSGGINETAADVAAEPSPPDGAAQKPSATGDTAGEVASTAGGSGTAADDGDGGGGASCGDGDGGKDAGMGDGSMRRKLERVSVLLRPIGSKEVRKAVHEFFRTTPGLPPMRTEAIVTQQQQQQQQSEPMELGPDAAAQQQQGSKRGPPGGTEDSQPAKWQKDSGRGGRGGGRGGRGRGGEAKQSQSGDRPQTQATATTCIEVAFDPCDLEEGGAGAGADSSHGGRGSGGRGRGRGGRRRGGGWEGGKHNFVRFVLYKENMDTQVALTILSRHLAIAAGGHNFGFAGTKDKRGVTCQFATAFKVSPSRLSTVNSHLRGIRVGNFSFCDEGLRLGCLSGNEFHLLMRDVRLASPEPPAVAAAAATTTAITADGEEAGPKGTSGTKIDSDVVAQVTAACETVARNGFINYFGLQRFGTGGAATQEVGKALLRGEYEKAARLVLTGRADERSDYADARRLFFDNGDAKGALRRLPHFMLGERAVLSVLATDPADWAGAMKAVPRTMRMMYLHAWQSYVWNSAASHRIRTYGRDGVVAGDLVLPRSSATAAGGEGLMLLGGVDDSGEGMEPEDESEGSAGTVTRRLALARLATEADVEAGRYNIFDVVLPLPGTEAQYPTHSTGAWIRKTAAEAGVDLDNPVTTSATNRELSFASLTGDYRYLLHRPKDFQFGFKRYTDPYDDSLILTDRDLLPKDPGSEKASQPQPQPQRQRQRQQQQEPEALGEGRGDEDGGASCSEATRTQPVLSAQLVNDPKPLLALELRFQLPPSCYATMLLRELMKTSTARTFHMGLSSAFAAPKSTEEAAEAEAQVVDAETTVAAIAEDAME